MSGTKRKLFVDYYLQTFNATKSAENAGYSPKTARQQGYLLLKDEKIKAAIQERLSEVHMSSDEALKRLADIARGDVGRFLTIGPDGYSLDLEGAKEITGLIKRIKNKTTIYKGKNSDREIHTEEIELYSALDALEKILQVHEKLPVKDFNIKVTINGADE